MNRIIVVVFVLISTSTLAQLPEKFFQLGASTHAYKGDLNDSYNNWSGGIDIGLKFNRKKRVNGSLILGLGKITGQKASLPTSQLPRPNSFFKTSYVTVNYSVQYNIVNKPNWRLFISQGIGILRYEPKDEFSISLQDQGDTRADNELYGNIMPILPTQLGGIYFFPNNYGIGAQLGYMNLTRDYIDNISELGTNSNGDNVLRARFAFYVPL